MVQVSVCGDEYLHRLLRSVRMQLGWGDGSCSKKSSSPENIACVMLKTSLRSKA